VGLDLVKDLLIKISLVDITSCHLTITRDSEECSASILKSSPRRLSWRCFTTLHGVMYQNILIFLLYIFTLFFWNVY